MLSGAAAPLLLAMVLWRLASGLQAHVLTLQRAFPVNESVGMDELRARDAARHARMLQQVVVGGVVDFQVVGSADPYLIGLYFTKVKLGYPPAEFNVQIDTGSDILWVNCRGCTGCPQISGLGLELNFFDVASSSSASMVSCSDPVCSSVVQTTAAGCSTETNQCGYSFQYGDGSGTSGYYVYDLLNFDTIMANSFVANSSAPVVFGCSTLQSGDLTKSVRAIDGIFGFGQQDLSVISQLSSRGITPKVFSHCLKGEGNGGGILVLGEILEPGIVYSPLVQSQPHYNLVMQSITVNGQALPIDPAVFATTNNQGTIIDSGTTLTYLVAEAYDSFVAAISASVSQSTTTTTSNGHKCFLTSTSITDIFPPVSLNFAGGASMLLRPQDYLIQTGFADGAAMWCIGFQRVPDDGITILGDLVLKDKIVVYDLARQRIGWANYDCSMSVNVSLTSTKDEFYNTGQLSVSRSSRKKLFELIPCTIASLLLYLLAPTWTVS
uniref:Peptidase A1 domain-containing protein n=1 Tax=Kalanchoe fedtschenkoi TaxID=63787 RepID=A0A7N0ZZK1_KALFE